MTYAGNQRKLGRVEQQIGKSHNPWLEAVYAIDREYRAKLARAKAEQTPAGADTQPMGSAAVMSAPVADPAQAESTLPVWTETVRPGRNDILTWDEAMRVPWIDRNDHSDDP